MTSAEKISSQQLYEDAKRFNDLCWDNPNTQTAMQEFEASTDYTSVGRGKYRSAFYREDLPGEEDTVVKFPNRVYKPEKSNQHNIDEYRAWESMDNEMREDFARVLDCGDEGEYLVQRRSEGNSFLGTLKLMLKYRYSYYPSDDFKPANIGVIDDKSVILDFPWGEIK